MGITEGGYDDGATWSLSTSSPNFFICSDGEIIPLDNLAFVCENGNQGSWLVYLKHGAKNTTVISHEDYLKMINLMGYE